jgi:hypothetical protein
MTWHADPALLSAYLAGDVDYPVGASVEQHLLRCAECRGRLAERPPVVPLSLVWDGIRETVEDPRPTAVERIACGLGLPDWEARLLAAAPSLTAAWIGSLAVSLAFAVLAAYYGDPQWAVVLFLLVAPLAPVAGVAVAYGPEGDPSHEAVAATPYPALRLVLLRSAAVLTTSVPLAVVGALLLPVPWWVAAGWLLPALACTAVVLALSTWFSTTVVATAVGVSWVGALVVAAVVREPYAVVAPQLQVFYVVVGLTAGAVLAARSRRSDISGSLS